MRKPRLRLALMLLRWVPQGQSHLCKASALPFWGLNFQNTDLWSHTQITFKPEYIGSKSKLRNLGMGHIPLKGVSKADESLGSSHPCSPQSRTSVKPCLGPFFLTISKLLKLGKV